MTSETGGFGIEIPTVTDGHLTLNGRPGDDQVNNISRHIEFEYFEKLICSSILTLIGCGSGSILLIGEAPYDSTTLDIEIFFEIGIL